MVVKIRRMNELRAYESSGANHLRSILRQIPSPPCHLVFHMLIPPQHLLWNHIQCMSPRLCGRSSLKTLPMTGDLARILEVSAYDWAHNQ
jgi:hypothetical protein